MHKEIHKDIHKGERMHEGQKCEVGIQKGGLQQVQKKVLQVKVSLVLLVCVQMLV